MAITNPQHIPESVVTLVTTTGKTLTVTVRNNDRNARCIWIEPDEGFFEAIPYSEIERARVPIVRPWVAQ